MEREGSTATYDDAGSSQLTRLADGGLLGWQAMLGFGVITVIIGLIVAFHPTTSLSAIAVLLGILLIVSGIFHLVRVFDRHRDDRVWAGILGLLFIVTGVVLIRHLHLTIALLGLIVGFTWIAQGVAALIGGFTGALGRGSGWSVFFGIISLIAGIVVVSAPITTVTAIAVLLGIWFVVMGIMEVIGAFAFRHAAHRQEKQDAAVAAEGAAQEQRRATDIPGQRAGEAARRDATSADRPSTY
jgi:uncharacterized membrane protein HdeD (DUF308 family)